MTIGAGSAGLAADVVGVRKRSFAACGLNPQNQDANNYISGLSFRSGHATDATYGQQAIDGLQNGATIDKLVARFVRDDADASAYCRLYKVDMSATYPGIPVLLATCTVPITVTGHIEVEVSGIADVVDTEKYNYWLEVMCNPNSLATDMIYIGCYIEITTVQP